MKQIVFLGATLIATLLSGEVQAQDLRYGGEAAEPCKTSTGLPGVLFKGRFSTIEVPEGFDSVLISD